MGAERPERANDFFRQLHWFAQTKYFTKNKAKTNKQTNNNKTKQKQKRRTKKLNTWQKPKRMTWTGRQKAFAVDQSHIPAFVKRAIQKPHLTK